MNFLKKAFQALGAGGSNSTEADDFVSVSVTLNHKLLPIPRGERYEDPLTEELERRGYGEIEGGGTFQNNNGEIFEIDLHLALTSPDESIPFVIDFLESRGAPKGSRLEVFGDDDDVIRTVPFGSREGVGIYLDGVNLPSDVYETSDIGFVIEEINKAVGDHEGVESYWEGPTETALYVYGDSFDAMVERLAELLGSYPLCQGARVVNLTSPQAAS